MDSRPKRWLLAFLLILSIASAVQAGPVTFSGSLTIPGNPNGVLSASVTFAHAGGGNLSVTLTNTSTYDVKNPSGLLNAVFFDIAENTALTRISGQVNTGSSVFFGNDGGGNIGGEWGYKRVNSGGLGGDGAPLVTQNQGIGSSGYDIFGPPYVFDPGNDLDGQGNGSPAYGLTSAGDNLAVGNAAVTGQFALIKNSVVFTLSGIVGLNDNTDLSALFSNIRFQYGTNLSEPSFGGTPDGGPNPVPVPAGVLMMGLGGICLAGYKVRRNRKVAKLA